MISVLYTLRCINAYTTDCFLTAIRYDYVDYVGLCALKFQGKYMTMSVMCIATRQCDNQQIFLSQSTCLVRNTPTNLSLLLPALLPPPPSTHPISNSVWYKISLFLILSINFSTSITVKQSTCQSINSLSISTDEYSCDKSAISLVNTYLCLPLTDGDVSRRAVSERALSLFVVGGKMAGDLMSLSAAAACQQSGMSVTKRVKLLQNIYPDSVN